MCFSADASFGLSAILVPAGAYCVWSAAAKNKTYLGLAIIPWAFAAQQFCEGLVWNGVDQDDPGLARNAAFFYLYFALAFWPFWIPFCTFLTEHNARRKRLWAVFAVLGFVGGVMLYLPLLLEPQVLIVDAMGHAIAYDITQSAAFRVMPVVSWQVLYVVIVGTPPLISPSRGFVFLGCALVVAATVSQVFYWYAFISVWCFFAAILSLYLCLSFRRLALPG
ncbi:MAG TPA: DUF6629 family protein [Gemmataceae bacterium]|nr:DUF6629 family protein [Gemmataceae bacterium]